jgi:conjugative relaxase-like TrwC/TraI family protein
VAAAFDHYTSRANDPQLHTHVVVINRVHTEDGWRALEARRNYLHAKAGGTIYETVLRDELTRRLGVSWGPVVNGIADISGFSPELLEHFSTRRAEILEAAEAYAARHGGQDPRQDAAEVHPGDPPAQAASTRGGSGHSGDA